MATKAFVLLPARHRHPVTDGLPALLESWDFDNRVGVLSEEAQKMYDNDMEVFDTPREDERVEELYLYINGFTPEVLWAIDWLEEHSYNYHLYHYDNVSGEYWRQELLNFA